MKYFQTSKAERETSYYLVDGSTVIELEAVTAHKRMFVTGWSGSDVDARYQCLSKAHQLKEISLADFLVEYNRWLRSATFKKGGCHE